MITWAFIFLSDDGGPGEHYTELRHDGNRLLVYGVNTVERGIALANRAIDEEGCSLIELCGGFGQEGARRVIEGTGGRAAVGQIEYLPGESEKFKAHKASLGL